MTENTKPEAVAWCYEYREHPGRVWVADHPDRCPHGAEIDPLIRLSDHHAAQEELQSSALGMAGEIEHIKKALRYVCRLYVADDYRPGRLRERAIDRAVSQALEAVRPTCKRDKKPCGEYGYCLECPKQPNRERLTTPGGQQ